MAIYDPNSNQHSDGTDTEVRHEEYEVVWRIDIVAASPRQAAYEALQIQRDPDSIASVFEVRLTRRPSEAYLVDFWEDKVTELNS